MRNKVTGTVQQIAHTGDRRALVESRVFDGGADENRTAARRDEIASRSPHDAFERGTVGRELQQLPSDRPNLQCRNSFDIDVPRPASGSDHNVMRGDGRVAVELDAD